MHSFIIIGGNLFATGSGPVSQWVSNGRAAGRQAVGQKLQEGVLVIVSSVCGCDKDIKRHCDGLGDNAGKVFMCLAAYEDHLGTARRQGILHAALQDTGVWEQVR